MRLSDKIKCVSTNVNLLRFVAAIFVIFSHSFYVATAQEDPFSVFSSGQTGFGGMAVAIFFFLSGLYVTKSLYKKNDAKDFLYKRFKRIFPQLCVVVILSIFVLGPIFTKLPLNEYFMDSRTYLHVLNALLIPIHNLPGVFEHNIYDATINGPLWTMSVEFAAYCALVLVLVVSKYIFKNIQLQKRFHVLCFLVLFVMFVILDEVVGNDFLITVMRPFVVFFMGVLYCDFSEKIKLNLSLAIAMIFIMILACKMGFLNYTMIFFLPYIVVTLALGTKQLQINSKMLLISYEMYLFGWPIQQAVVACCGGQMNPWLNCFITLPIDIIFAYILYVFVEKMDKKFL